MMMMRGQRYEYRPSGIVFSENIAEDARNIATISGVRLLLNGGARLNLFEWTGESGTTSFPGWFVFSHEIRPAA
jgi:hypothetical protein